jgi:predicted nucleic acid-binding protein
MDLTQATGLTLDTGALLALERGQERIRALLRVAVGREIAIPAGVVAQAWRGGPRQARIARLIKQPETAVLALDDDTARAVGLLCGRSGHGDVVDVAVVLCAREHRHAIVTSDPDDLRRVDPSVPLVPV